MMVTGFNSNDAPLQGEMYGTVFMHAVGVDEQDAVGSYRMSMTTIPGLAFNLFPERSLYELGYKIVKNINGDSSMTKCDSDGKVIHRIPIFYDAEHAHHVVHMAVSRTKHNSKLSKLISDSTATINRMYITSPKSRGYDGSESDDDLEIHDDEYVTERSMQEHLDYENAIARSAQEAVEESQEKSQKILPTATRDPDSARSDTSILPIIGRG